MATNLHFNQGRVLLKSDSSWYYVNVNVIDSTAYLQVAQDSSLGSVSFGTFVVLKGNDGSFYRLALRTLEDGIVYSAALPTDPTAATRLFLRGTDEEIYEVLIVAGQDGQVYIQPTLIGTNVATVGLPWKELSCIDEDLTKRKNLVESIEDRAKQKALSCVAEDTTKRRTLAEVSILAQRTVIVPA